MAQRKSRSKKTTRPLILDSELAHEISNDFERGAAMAMHALVDIAITFPSLGLFGLTVESCIQALASKVYRQLARTGKAIPADHPASVEFLRLRTALHCMEELIGEAVGDGYVETSMSREAVGRCLYAFMCDAATALDKAQQALLGQSSMGLVTPAVDYQEAQQYAARFNPNMSVSTHRGLVS